MGKEERIIFALGFVALVAIMIFYRGGGAPLTGAAPTEPPATATGPIDYEQADIFNYLTYNQPGWMAPPVAGILPQTASGQLGQSLPYADHSGNVEFGCGCS